MMFLAFAMGVFFSRGPAWAFWLMLAVISVIEGADLIAAFYRGLVA